MASEFLIDTIGVFRNFELGQKTKGLINLVKPEMDKLISKGYRISDKLYNQILARNNEVIRRGTNIGKSYNCNTEKRRRTHYKGRWRMDF